ncbi:hypothetical protein ACHAXR_012768 [Thalassiosira sp. AJA248-18]
MTPFIRVILETKPVIVKKTTRSPKTPIISDVIEALKYCFVPLNGDCSNANSCSSIEATFDDLILPRQIKECVLDLAYSVSNARKNSTPFRHFILHGPDGAGKSMAAKKIAKVADIDFAHVCGRRVFTTGDESVSQIQTLFSWAKMSPKGMLLFIDEAETFLGSTDSSLMNETSSGHNALSAFLYNISKLRKRIILVLATNRVQDLDKEVLVHFTERIFLPLPDAGCRNELILSYFDLCVQKFVECKHADAFSFKSTLIQFVTRQAPVPLSIEEDLMSGEQLEEVVAATRGLSGDDIRELMIAMQRALCDSENGKLDFAMAWKLVEAKVKHHRDCQTMAGEHKLAGSYLDGDIDLQDITFV